MSEFEITFFNGRPRLPSNSYTFTTLAADRIDALKQLFKAWPQALVQTLTERRK